MCLIIDKDAVLRAVLPPGLSSTAKEQIEILTANSLS